MSANGINVDYERIKKIINASVCKSEAEPRSFLELALYYRRFIQGFAKTEAPLHAKNKPKTDFSCSESMSLTRESLKIALPIAPVLIYPDFFNTFTVKTDAFSTGVGAIFAQRNHEDKSPSHTPFYTLVVWWIFLRKYTICETEVLAVTFASETIRHYLLPAEPFTIVTVHQALCSLFKKQNFRGHLITWLDLLTEYRFDNCLRKWQWWPSRRFSVATAANRSRGLWSLIIGGR